MESSLTPKYAENLKVKQSLPLTSRQDCCNVVTELHKVLEDKSDKQSLIHFVNCCFPFAYVLPDIGCFRI